MSLLYVLFRLKPNTAGPIFAGFISSPLFPYRSKGWSGISVDMPPFFHWIDPDRSVVPLIHRHDSEHSINHDDLVIV